MWDLYKIILIFSGGIFSFGYLISSFLGTKNDSKMMLFSYFVIGLQVYYLIVVLSFPLSYISYLCYTGMMLMVCRIIFLVVKKKLEVKRSTNLATYIFFSCTLILVSCYVFYPTYKGMVFQPINHWDSVCSWFYYCKQMYFADGINDNTGFTIISPYNVQAHPYYPKLISSVGSYIAIQVGFWNEYLPKSCFLIYFIAFVLSLVSATNVPILARIALPFVLITFNIFMLSIGYMDGWQSVFVGVSLMFIISYIGSGSREDLLNFLISLSLLLNIKNEGILLVACILVATVLAMVVFYRGNKIVKYSIIVITKNFLFLVVAVSSFVAWSVRKQIWGFIKMKDFDFSRFFDFDLMMLNFGSNRFQYVYTNVITNFSINTAFMFSIFCFCFSILFLFIVNKNRRKFKMYMAAALIPLLSFLFYAGFLILSYVFALKIDLELMVGTTADRTYIPFFVCCFMVVFASIHSFLNPSFYFHSKTLKKVNVKKK